MPTSDATADLNALDGKTAELNPDAMPTRYVNGLWYSKTDNKIIFEPGERCQVAGVFVGSCPETANIIDLAGGYIIPALGDAHNHNVDGPWRMDAANNYLRNGVFYMRNLNSVNSVDAWASAMWETADTFDIAWTHAGISVDEGHPETLYRNLADVYRLDAEKLEGEVFWEAATPEMLDEKWPLIMATDPDWIKVYLIETEYEGERKLAGLSREVFAHAVKRTHESGLKAIAHINTAMDFKYAVELGADGAAHLPPTFVGFEDPDDMYRISDSMAEAAAKSSFVVTPTAALIDERDWSDTERSRQIVERTRMLQAENLKTLRRAGVTLALGSDLYDGDAVNELKAIARRNVYSNEELLEIAVTTPSTSIFPDRAIGTLDKGWEASFLALPCDPRENIDCVTDLSLAVKQGVAIELTKGEADG